MWYLKCILFKFCRVELASSFKLSGERAYSATVDEHVIASAWTASTRVLCAVKKS